MDLRKDILYYDALVDFPTNGQENKLYLNKADGALYYWDGSAYSLAGDGSGGVTSVTASAPLASSGGAIPNISLTIPSDNTKFLDGSGAFDTVKDSDLSLSDITTNDVSTAKHGFAPKAPNDATKFLDGTGAWSTPAGGSSSGIFGIANTSGVYTFYATLTLAMTAATAGQTIEMFADVTETGNVTITLKNGVTINGNGHTYAYTNTAGSMFIDNGSIIKVFIQNLHISRTSSTVTSSTNAIINSTAASEFVFQGGSQTMTISSGSYNMFYNVTSNGVIFRGLNAYGIGAATVVQLNSTGGGLFDSYIKATGSSNAIEVPGGCIIKNVYITCTGSGKGISVSTGATDVDNCVVYANSGTAVDISSTGKITNSFCSSVSGYGSTGAGTMINSTSISSSGNGSSVATIISSYCKSASGYAHFNSNLTTYNSTYISDANSVFYDYAQKMYNCTMICNYNNSAGHCLRLGNAGGEVVNCYMKVTNSSAYCITGLTPFTIKYASNIYSGSTTPVYTTNITQGISNTQDNQGNILL